MDIQVIPYDRAALGLGRVETGPVQFGDDWPGIFIRGDRAFAMAMALDHALADDQPFSCEIYKAQARSIAKLLRSCIVEPSPKPDAQPLGEP